MKAWRQKKILEIIKQQAIETQEELVDALHAQGLTVTQATISRDIKELCLIKVPVEKNKYRYAAPGETMHRGGEERLRRLFRNSVVDIDHSENLVVIKTLPGEAQGVASALDHINWPEIIGTVAGDDTILVIVKPKKQTVSILSRFNEMVRG